MKTARWMMLCLLFSMLPATVATAQQHVSGWSADWGAWKLRPLYTSSSGNATVEGFLALAQSQAVTGDNIAAVWYIRDVQTDTWTMKTWFTQDATEAIKSVKINAGIPDSEDHLWDMATPLAILPGDDPEDPKDYSKGLMTMDPLFPLIEASSDSEELVAFLTNIGYKSATIAIDFPGECAEFAVLNGVAEAFEFALDQVIVDEPSAALAAEGASEKVIAAIACKQTTPPSPTCTPSITPFVATPAVAGVCNWVLLSSSSTPTTGGRNYTCAYEARKYFTQTRSATGTRADCTTYICTQIRVGYASAPASCVTFVPTGTTFTCPAAPSCAGPASGTTACAALAATTWGAWGPPCPQ